MGSIVKAEKQMVLVSIPYKFVIISSLRNFSSVLVLNLSHV